ncbi:MAG: hypothetical protein ABF296_02700 [Oceanococcaceae bacterium]
MPDPTGLLLILLPLAAASGWFVARMRPAEERDAPLNPRLTEGLGLLVNNQTDAAIDLFMNIAEAEPETVELQLTLGNLFRRRGEIDRALRVHHQLSQNIHLPPLHRNRARFELASDYLRAGILDRAQRLFRELADQGIFLEASLQALGRIHEQQRDWEAAIDTLRWLSSAKGRDFGPTIAHYYCELALQAQKGEDAARVDKLLRKAHQADPRSVRVSLVRAEVLQAAGQKAKALDALLKVPDKDPRFIPEVVARLEPLCSAPDERARYVSALQKMAEKKEGVAAAIALAHWREQNGEEGLEILLDEIRRFPNWIAMQAALELPWPEAQTGPEFQELLEALRGALEPLLSRRIRYLCDHCGYGSGMLNWQCPSCKSWGHQTPVTDLRLAQMAAPRSGINL